MQDWERPHIILLVIFSDLASIKTCVENAINPLGGLHYLINCAANYNRAKAHECNLETWDNIIDTNVRKRVPLFTTFFTRNK